MVSSFAPPPPPPPRCPGAGRGTSTWASGGLSALQSCLLCWSVHSTTLLSFHVALFLLLYPPCFICSPLSIHCCCCPSSPWSFLAASSLSTPPSSLLSFLSTPLSFCSPSSLLSFLAAILSLHSPSSLLSFLSTPFSLCSPSSLLFFLSASLPHCHSSTLFPFVTAPLPLHSTPLPLCSPSSLFSFSGIHRVVSCQFSTQNDCSKTFIITNSSSHGGWGWAH